MSASLPLPVRRGPKLTRRGWGLLVLMLGTLGAGLWWHEVALVHMALFLLLLLGVGWWLARRNLDGIEIDRSAPASTFVGEWIPVSVRLRGPKRLLGASAVELSDELLGFVGEGMAARRLRPGEVCELTGQTRLRKRGLHPLFRWELASTFPAGLWQTRVHGWHSMPITVFPRPVTPVELDDPKTVLDDEEGALWQPKPDWGGDFLGIRDFQPGDPLKHIHWPASARAQRLVVREYDQRLPASHALFFHSWQPPGHRRMADAFEAALELLTGLLLRCTDEAVPVTLSADFLGWRTIRLEGTRSLGETLALLAAAKWSPSHDFDRLAEQLKSVPIESHVFIVSDTPLRHWQPLLSSPAGITLTCLSVGELRRRHVFRATARATAVS
ncbi:MAG: DUF58 domain-containing protein [Verrucomicrobiales bacterium]